jgi:UDP-GlcNAc:undecaprenyl-phosphate GlcNAc-1-phosphate transferase
MITYVLIFAAALAFAVGGTPIARKLAWRSGTTDAPSSRKVHTEPMPLLGGAAIFASVMLALLIFGERHYVSELAGILIGATLMSFLGLWDDRRPIRPVWKLVGQVAVAGVLIASGVHVQLTGIPALDYALTFAWVLAITNAINFMDNMDGLAAGVSAVAAATFLLLAVDNGQQLVAPLSAAVLGACVGFLVYNFNPAVIFMGDHGSLFLGFLLAALGIKLRFPGRPIDTTWMIPLMVLAVPIFDLTLVLLSRLRRGVNPFTAGGTDHFSHRLVAGGATTREAALTVYLLACAAGGSALFTAAVTGAAAWAVLAGVLAVGLWGLWRLELSGSAGERKNPSGY